MSAPPLTALLLAVIIGAVLPMQGLVNARLGQSIGGPVVAAFVSFLIGTLVLGAWLLITRQRIGVASGTLPGWIWLGGVMGAAYVTAITLLMPRLGSAATMCLLILGQVVSAMLLQHAGVLQAARPMDLVRVTGAVLVLCGVVLVVKPWGAH